LMSRGTARPNSATALLAPAANQRVMGRRST
jgi:hypothetical protein